MGEWERENGICTVKGDTCARETHEGAKVLLIKVLPPQAHSSVVFDLEGLDFL